MTPEQRAWLKRPTILPPTLRSIEGTRLWQFCEQYEVSLPPPQFPLRLVIPVGWCYDRASIPPAVPGFIIDRDKVGTLAPAPHDAGFQVHGVFDCPQEGEIPTRPYIVDERGIPISLTVRRSTVDEWFLLYMLRQRIPSFRAYGAYSAVRFAWFVSESLGRSRRW